MIATVLGLLVAQAHEGAAEAPNYFLPETTEIIWGGLAFVLIAIPLVKFGLPAAKKMAAERTARLKGELDSAAEAQAAATARLAASQARKADVDQEAARLVAEAQEAADSLRGEAVERLRREEAALRARTTEDLAGNQGRVAADLQHTAAGLAIGAAERIVAESLDLGTQQALVEAFITKVGASGS